MSEYAASPEDGVIRVADDTFIARNSNDPDWQAFLAWQAGGGELAEYVPPEDPWAWCIDIGPFFDRFGAAKMPVLASTNAIVKAILTDVSIRKWIDLRNPSVAQGIDTLMALGIPITPAMRTAILTAPVTEIEQSAVRKLYEK